jgi:hypothetical protein
MPLILITCPTTGKPTPTGMSAESVIDLSSFETNAFGPCPHCGSVHKWNGSVAYFENDRKSRFRNQQKQELLMSVEHLLSLFRKAWFERGVCI